MSWDIRGKRVVITGGNTGIGKAAAEELCRRGAKVLITARDEHKGHAAVESIRATQPDAAIEWRLLDLAQRASIRSFAAGLLADFEHLDVLILNAGLILSERQEQEGGVEATFGVNHLGHFLLAHLLEARLRESAPARIVVVASRAYLRKPDGLDFDDLQFKRKYSASAAYGASKLANILYTRELARRLAGSGVTANCLHPGVVATDFAGDGDTTGLWRATYRFLRAFLLSPEKGARTTVYLAADPSVAGKSGDYYAQCKRRSVLPVARDDEAARRLWRVSEELLGL